MSGAVFRLFVDDRQADRETLDRVERITVEQQIDMIWQALVELPICTDERGEWSGEDEELTAAFSRLRVEVKVGEGDFVALIDGPVVGVARRMSAEPGRSTAVLRVHDDSTYLNRDEAVESMEDLRDHEVAERLFGQVPQIASTEVETTTAPASGLPPAVVRRGTPMQLLRRLARRQGMHAYVLPGERPGQSRGFFTPLPTRGDGLRDLVLLGADRNVTRFDVQDDALRPARVRGQSLDVADRQIRSATSSAADLEVLGEENAVGADAATVLAPPGLDGVLDPDSAVAGMATRASYGLRASGGLISGCYGGVLSPYRVVTVKAVNVQMSGDYAIAQVTHGLDRSAYTQSFRLRRNARSTAGGGGIPGGIF